MRNGFGGAIEILNTTHLFGDWFNSTTNGRVTYPTVADPDNTDLHIAVLNYAPSDRQEDAWRAHFTEKMFDLVLTAPVRPRFLYTHPLADTARYNVFRWTPADSLRSKEVTLCGKLFSNLGNGVELRVIRLGQFHFLESHR